MSESVRTLEQIQGEFNLLCAKAGHAQYQISVLEKDLEVINRQIEDLNLEASQLSKAEAEKAAASAPSAEPAKESE